MHNQGAGHRARMRATAPLLSVPVTALGASPDPCGGAIEWVALADDRTAEPIDPMASGTLHWAPLRLPGHRARMARVSRWIDEARPAAMVVDVSVEVAVLARLHGVPTVVVAQRGRRTDEAHRLAYRQAAAVVAPWSAASHFPADLPDAGNVHFIGGLSRFDDRRFHRGPRKAHVLVLVGAGGHEITGPEIEAAAQACPERHWHIAGPVSAGGVNVTVHGPDAPVAELLDRCSVVVGSGGGNVVAEVAAARRAFVCLPQPRPFHEQRRQAAALARIGAAVTCSAWPAPEAWPTLLRRAEALDPVAWSRLHDGGAALRFAQIVESVARCA